MTENEGTVTATDAEHRALLLMLYRLGNRWRGEDMAEAIRQREQNEGRRRVPLEIGEHRTEMLCSVSCSRRFYWGLVITRH